MPKPAALLKAVKAFALSLPGTAPKSPWPGHDDVAVNDKTFLYLGADEAGISIGVKLPGSGKEVLRLPHTAPMAYGLGRSGWVRVQVGDDSPVELETAKRWVWESYRAQAPKRLVKQLEAEQPWIAGGGLPEARR